MTNTSPETGYAPANGLKMYYEVRGEGEPVIVLHGAYMTVDAMAGIVSELAKTRRVIAVELQGHGRTADAQRPITYEQMADDVAALVEHLGLETTDVFGFSMGSGVAVQLAVRHPEVVRRMVVASVSYSHDGMHPEIIEMLPSITPEMLAGSPMEEEYKRLAPNPDDFPVLVEKLKQLDMTPFAWPEEDIRGIAAPTFLIVGDSDVVRLEHVVEFFNLLGGSVMGDLVGMPVSRLAVLPATLHFQPVMESIPPGSGVMERIGWFMPMITEFLDTPMREVESE